MWKSIAIVMLLIILAGSAAAVSVQSDKIFVQRGQQISITGECGTQPGVSVKITSGTAKILDTAAQCSAGLFELPYASTFLDPVGKWTIAANDGTETSSTEILADDAREGGFFLVRFLSPAEGKYARTETISLTVEVTDSGRKVDDANVAFFDFEGNRIFLKGVGEGIYTADYEIPADAGVGKWSLEVFAQSTSSGVVAGGRNAIGLEIGEPPVKIQVIEPSVTSFEIGDEVKIKLAVTYFNGKSLGGDAKVSALAGDNRIELIQTAENTFEGKFTAQSTSTGALELLLEAEDGAGNKGTALQKLVVGCSITCLAKNYGVFVLLALVVIAAVVTVLYSKLSSRNQLGKLQAERQKTLDLVKSLQEDYFGKGVMPSSSYKKNLSDYKAKLSEIEQKIADLKSKKDSE